MNGGRVGSIHGSTQRPTRRTFKTDQPTAAGRLGEASAIEWFTRLGAAVLLPVGHSPDCDLVAELDGRLLRIQVKTSTQFARTPDGHTRRVVSLRTCGGNQSWTGVSKEIDPARVDLLFILTGDGRRWVIPSDALEARNSIRLGGVKYSEYVN